ncbi:MAG: hypothetical protein V8R75_09820 [Oscillospiraceae bacterium]
MKRELLIDCHTGTQDLPALLLVSRVKDAEIRALTACYDPDRPVADIQDLLALREAAGLLAECSLGARRPIIPRRPCNGGPGTGAEHPRRRKAAMPGS